MYSFGQHLILDIHFQDHFIYEIPIQVYLDKKHMDIGFVTQFSEHFIKINDTYYNRSIYSFISRPGY